jgi:hypothetical protein
VVAAGALPRHAQVVGDVDQTGAAGAFQGSPV